MDPIVQAALIAVGSSVLTTVVLRYSVDDRLDRRRAERSFAFDQRRKIRETMSEFEGPLVQAAEEFHYRLQNVYRNADKAWLKNGASGPGYYLDSTAYRLIALLRLAVLLERRALYLDPKFREERDTITVRYAKAFQVILANTDIARDATDTFDGSRASDHIFQERLRGVADLPVPDGTSFTFALYNAGLRDAEIAREVVAFIEDLHPKRTPIRWDRLVSLDLLVCAFMHRIGFDTRHTLDSRQVAHTVDMYSSATVPMNLVGSFLARVGLENEKETRQVVDAIRARFDSQLSPG